MKFKAVIKNKTITFGNEIYARHHLGKYEGKDVIVTVDKVTSKRTLNQNRYYWACLDIISDSTGHEPEELHRIFRSLFLPREEVELNGKRFSMTSSTTDLSSGAFTEYLMKISAEVGSMGISLPSPDDYKRGLDKAVLLTD